MELTKKRLDQLAGMFRYKFRLGMEDCYDCATILLRKSKWVDRKFCHKMVFYAYVDFMREKFARVGKDGDDSKSLFLQSLHSWEEYDDRVTHSGDWEEDPPDANFTRIVQVLRKYGTRSQVGKDNRIKYKDGLIHMSLPRPMSHRRILFKYLTGWMQSEIGEYVGLTESRISQIIGIECIKIRKKLINEKRRKHKILQERRGLGLHNRSRN